MTTCTCSSVFKQRGPAHARGCPLWYPNGLSPQAYSILLEHASTVTSSPTTPEIEREIPGFVDLPAEPTQCEICGEQPDSLRPYLTKGPRGDGFLVLVVKWLCPPGLRSEACFKAMRQYLEGQR